MTMVIVIKNKDNIIMTADKRITITYINGKERFEDDHKKIKIIDNKYIISFAGRTFVAEQAFHFIEKEKNRLLDYTQPVCFFREAFMYGKSLFEDNYPGIAAISVFYLGFIDHNKPALFGFSSDNDYEPKEINGISIKINALNAKEEERLIEQTREYINSEIEARNVRGGLSSLQELAEICFLAIKRINDQKIGKTAYTVILSPFGIEELEHE